MHKCKIKLLTSLHLTLYSVLDSVEEQNGYGLCRWSLGFPTVIISMLSKQRPWEPLSFRIRSGLMMQSLTKAGGLEALWRVVSVSPCPNAS